MHNLIVTARDVWDGVIWPRYEPPLRSAPGAAPLTPGALVMPAPDVVGLQSVEGTLVDSTRLGTGIVAGYDAEGRVLVRWSQAAVETWAAADELAPLAPGTCLVTIVRRDGRGHRTLLRRGVALLQHHWTIELLPDDVVRAVRADGLSWTFTVNPVSHDVTTTWPQPPEDDDAEALTAAEFAAA